VHSRVRARHLTTRMVLFAVLLCPAISSAQPRSVRSRIGAARTGAPISKYLYGQFVEHVGGIVNKEVRGIQQAGLAVRKGRSCTGRVVLAGTPGTTVRTALVWGTAPADRQTVVIDRLGSAYQKHPLRLEAAADTDDRLEIVGTGTGSFHVGWVRRARIRALESSSSRGGTQ